MKKKKKLKQKYNIVKDTQFPEISRFDPVSVFIVFVPDKFLKLYVLVQRHCKQNIIAYVYK